MLVVWFFVSFFPSFFFLLIINTDLDYRSSMEYSVATAAARSGVAGWNNPFAELESVMARPSARELIRNPPVATVRITTL